MAKNNSKDIVDVKYLMQSFAAKEPKQAHTGDAGFDLVAVNIKRLGLFKWEISSCMAFKIPEGYEMQLRARSSIHKQSAFLSNGIGTIDSGYRGAVKAVFYTLNPFKCPYKKGERFCQIVINKIPNVTYSSISSLDDTDRGEGGYGSTGK